VNPLQALEQVVAIPCPLVGCTRANQWGSRNWRNVRGDAVLAAIGTLCPIDTPAGPFNVYLFNHDILQFRGGQWKDWWRDDCQLLGAVVNNYTSFNVKTVDLIQEVDGNLSIHYIDIPTSDEAQVLISRALRDWWDAGRIAKDSPRAYVCKFCSVKGKCDALDQERGQTHDWPPNYKVG